MIEGLKPYEEYKDSGQDWLGRVPGHWDLLPNRALFDEVNERNHPNEEMLSVTITRGIIRQRALLSDTSKKDSSNTNKSSYKFVRLNDIAYNKMRAWQGALGASPLQGIISPAYVVMRPRGNINPWYFHHLYRTPHFAKEAERWSYGITSDMWSLRSEHFKVIYTALPPTEEQAAIVKFLDHANRKIDRFIRAKKKKIALLNEQKQVIIHRAVTRGLDPNVKLKPSGIDWLDSVPEHWEVLRLGRVIRFITGFPFKSEGFTQKEHGTRLLRGINVTPLGVRWDATVRWIRKDSDGLDSFSLAVGDIVLGMDRPIVASGVRATCIEEQDIPSLLLQRVTRLRPTERILGEFLLLLLRGKLFMDYMAPIFTGISVPHLSPEQICNFKIMLPDIDEQQQICSFILRKTSHLEVAAKRIQREIDLIQEYRTRLTADIVTGKLDVREAAAKLPDLEEDVKFETPDDLVDNELMDDGDLGEEA